MINNYNFENKKVILRTDFNVPIDSNYKIIDNLKIIRIINTIKKITDSNGSVIIISHLGRPKGGYEYKYSLIHIYNYISSILKYNNIYFVNDCMSKEALSCAKNLSNGEILILENLRFYDNEMENNIEFAKKLHSYGDVYINDAFSVSHRESASIINLPQMFNNKNRMLGYAFLNEIKHINNVLQNSQKPFTAIIGGAKISDKINFIEKLLSKVDNIIIGGAMAFTFIKAFNYNIGNSLYEKNYVKKALEILNYAEKSNIKIYLPLDIKIANKICNNCTYKNVNIDSIPDNWYGLDIGYKTIQNFNNIISFSKSIIWNGPLGHFEFDNFHHGSYMITRNIAFNTSYNNLYSLIGGGDTAFCVKKTGFFDQMSYVSSGGGALLDYITKETLPGIEAIK
ncbi:MAG: phosphoglycerate kinase [Bacteroides sp.]|nr:MAG: phosphoglycerate kinase [Bacteroides sp.]